MSSVTGETGGFGSSSVEIPIDATSINQIVGFLIRVLVNQGRLQTECADQIRDLVLHRESLGATAIGRGIAVPQAQTDLVKKTLILMGRCIRPVQWPGSADHQPVNWVCLLIAPNSPDEFKKALELVALQLRGISGA